jgi:LmbE family N-acetylglucosaminyl deacetylase
MDIKFLLKSIGVFLFAIIGSYIVYYLPVKVDVEIKRVNLNKYKNVMIVAHPDDEIIFGGAHLIQDDYLVVCITCGTNKKRLNEFKKVMNITGNSYMALGYPDKTDGKRDEWITFYDDIKKDIELILDSNDWKTIVTHNEKGEYGHIQHIKTNKIVTELYSKSHYSGDLYYFGKYYTKKNIVDVEKDLKAISPSLVEKKEELLKVYKSQAKVVKKLIHMNKYEMWELYKGDKDEEKF